MPNNQIFTGDYKTIYGNNNVISGDYNNVYGNNNVINGDYNNISGNSNVINGDYNNINGNNNRMNGDFNNDNGNNNSGGSSSSKGNRSNYSSGISNSVISSGGSNVIINQSSGGSTVNGRRLKPRSYNTISTINGETYIDGVRITPQNEHLYYDDVQSNNTIVQRGQTITQTFRNRRVDDDGDMVLGNNYTLQRNTQPTTRASDDCGSRSTTDNDDLTEEEKKAIKLSELEIRLNKILKEVDDDNEESKKLQCSVCMAYEKNALFGCGHKYCSKCAFQLYHEKKDCPSCREKITTVIQLLNDE